MVKEWCWFSQTNVFHEFFQVDSMFSVLLASLISSTYTDKKSPLARLTYKHSQLKTFPNRVLTTLSQIAFLMRVPARGWTYRFLARGTTGSSTLDHESGHLCFGRRIQISGRSDFGIFAEDGASSILTWVSADILHVLPVLRIQVVVKSCPWHLRPSFWDADDPCSVNTAHEPESSFTMSPRSTTPPSYVWHWKFQLRIS